MKDFLLSAILFLIVLFGTSITKDIHDIKEYARINGLNQDTIIMELRNNTHIDAVYSDHLAKCSFISNDQIKITKNHYVKVIPATGYVGRFDITMNE